MVSTETTGSSRGAGSNLVFPNSNKSVVRYHRDKGRVGWQRGYNTVWRGLRVELLELAFNQWSNLRKGVLVDRPYSARGVIGERKSNCASDSRHRKIRFDFLSWLSHVAM